MSEPSSEWIEDAFRQAGKDALKASKDINHYLGAIDLIYTYSCLDRDIRHCPTDAELCHYVSFVQPFKILWNVRTQALNNNYSLPALAKQFKTMLKEVLSQRKPIPEAEKEDGLLSDHLDNIALTTAMFDPLLVDMKPWTEKLIYRNFFHKQVSMIIPDDIYLEGWIVKHAYIDNPHEIGIVIDWCGLTDKSISYTETYRQSQYLNETFLKTDITNSGDGFFGMEEAYGMLDMDYGLTIVTKFPYDHRA